MWNCMFLDLESDTHRQYGFIGIGAEYVDNLLTHVYNFNIEFFGFVSYISLLRSAIVTTSLEYLAIQKFKIWHRFVI